MSRNTLVGALAALASGLLVAAAVGAYRTFSYLAAAFIPAVVAAGAIEHGDGEFDLAPYGGLAVGLAALFVAGLTGIWLLWSPGLTEYVYVAGLPRATLVYVVFIWLLPLLGAVYYSLVFPSVGSDEIVETVLSTATAVQRRERLPLSVRGDADAGADVDAGAGADASAGADGGGETAVDGDRARSEGGRGR